MCDKTFSYTEGAPYYRLEKPLTLFEEIAELSVNGVDKSTIARDPKLAWNTATQLHARNLDRARKETEFAMDYSERLSPKYVPW